MEAALLRRAMEFDPFQLIDKKERKALTRRSDWIGLSYLATHLMAIGVGGYLIYLTYGTWLMPVAGLAFSALMGVSLATLAPYGGSARSTSALSAILDSGSRRSFG